MKNTEREPTAWANRESDDTVVGAYDAIDGTATFVIADTTQDDAWIGMATDTVIDLDTYQ